MRKPLAVSAAEPQQFASFDVPAWVWAALVGADKRERGQGPDHLARGPMHPHPSAEPEVSDPTTAPREDQRTYLDR